MQSRLRVLENEVGHLSEGFEVPIQREHRAARSKPHSGVSARMASRIQLLFRLLVPWRYSTQAEVSTRTVTRSPGLLAP